RRATKTRCARAVVDAVTERTIGAPRISRRRQRARVREIAGAVRARGDAAHRPASHADHARAARAERTSRAGHAGSAELLELDLCRGAEGVAGAVSEASVARR